MTALPPEATKIRKGTCDGCGRVRKLGYPPRSNTLRGPGEEISYYGLCAECYPKVKTQADIIKLRREREPRESKPRFAYPIIGGPLDGEYAVTADFRRRSVGRDGTVYSEGGMYGHLADEYAEYNSASGSRKRLGSSPSMIFIHRDLLRPLARPADR